MSQKVEAYYMPHKKWWQFWKRNKMLVEGKDFQVDKNGTLTSKKALHGELSISYEYEGTH